MILERKYLFKIALPEIYFKFTLILKKKLPDQ
jgi:hypothetical protein